MRSRINGTEMADEIEKPLLELGGSSTPQSHRIGRYAPPKQTNGLSGNSTEVLYQNQPSSGAGGAKYKNGIDFYQPTLEPYQKNAEESTQGQVLVTVQPIATTYDRRYGNRDYNLLLSILLSLVCFFCGTWWALICTIPAIFYAISAQDAEAMGYHARAKQNGAYALILNIGGVITYIISWTIILIVAVSLNL